MERWKNKVDDTDRKILNLLQKDDKMAYKDIGDRLDIAASTVHTRVKKMEKKGIIEKFSAVLNPKQVGYNTTAWLGLSVDPLKMNAVAEKIAQYDNVQVVATSTGDHDMVVQLLAKDEKHLWRFLNKHIKTIEGVNPKMDVSSFIDIFKQTNFVKLNKTNKKKIFKD
jgi:Lrp/AsnC family transcriptional regulator for asnA, asnC and gidA